LIESRYKRWLRIGAVFVVTALFLYLAFGKLDWAQVAGVLPSISLIPLLLVLPVFAAEYFLRIVRWWWMLREIQPHITIRACAGPLMAGYAVNNTVPLRAGDVIRAVGFRHQLQTPVMRLLGTIAIERVLDLFVVLLFFSIAMAITQPSRIPPEWLTGTLWIATTLSISIALVITFLRPMGNWLERLVDVSKSRGRPVQFVVSKTRHVLDALELLRSPKLMLELIAQTFVIWTLEGCIYLIVAFSMHFELPTFAPWFVMAMGALGTAIPSSPGHLGTFDYFAMESLAAYGTQRELAGVFAIIVHILLWLPGTVVGGLYLLFSGRLHKSAISPTT
jgi:uncharacterized protein (TIRG00374 family)